MTSLDAVPLFPLPNVVLFPGAVLPLHIFEERYKAMTADVLAGDRQLAMALLCPDWEKSYYGRPEIERVVCVGTIVSAEQVDDGKYNFLLHGHTRAVIDRELDDHYDDDDDAEDDPARRYRVARLRPLEQVPVMEIDLGEARARIEEIFNTGALGQTSVARQFRKLLGGERTTPDVCDLIAFNVLDDVPLKQSLLAEIDVRTRVRRTIDALAKAQRQLGPALRPGEVNMN